MIFINSVHRLIRRCTEKDGTDYVAVKPICQALGIDPSSQIRDLKDDLILSSVVVNMTTTGADGKGYEMVCIPVRDFKDQEN